MQYLESVRESELARVRRDNGNNLHVHDRWGSAFAVSSRSALDTFKAEHAASIFERQLSDSQNQYQLKGMHFILKEMRQAIFRKHPNQGQDTREMLDLATFKSPFAVLARFFLLGKTLLFFLIKVSLVEDLTFTFPGRMPFDFDVQMASSLL